jgi:two-component system, chemotaxis family, protein-glutamate methylesterase/glutaminase
MSALPRLRKVRVLVVEDSPSVRMLLVHLIDGDPELQVIGTVGDGVAAVEFVHAHPVDVVVMDINMPRMNGIDATRHIMQSQPVPIVVCSATVDTRDLLVVFQAMQAGAIACIEKPVAVSDPEKARRLVETVKNMARVRVARRQGIPAGAHRPRAARFPARPTPYKLVGIGTSTGGPAALQVVLSGLPRDFPVPILVVQHITAGFLPGLVAWLNETLEVRAEIAVHGVRPVAGRVYLAPDDRHLGVDVAGRIALSTSPAENHLRPAASFLFRSMVKTHGPNAIGVLLTGMGRDGAEEMAAMCAAGAFTIAQDEATSVVHGMPGAAIEKGAAKAVLPLAEISETLIALTRRPAA